MPYKKLSISLSYIGIALLIFSCWGLSWYHDTSHTTSISSRPIASLDFERKDLKKALSGDVTSIKQLFYLWKEKKRIFRDTETTDRSLSHEEFNEALTLADHLLTCKTGEQNIPHFPLEKTPLTDDWGTIHQISTDQRRLLPQTYLAASVLLSVADIEQIVAIPQGMRLLPNLYPADKMSKISLDTNRFHAELLFQASPKLAFVSHYSTPAMVQTLRNQGLSLFAINKLDTIDDVPYNIERISKVAGQSSRGRLLALFFKAAMEAIDSEITDYRASMGFEGSTLYLNYYTHLSTPTLRPLTGQLMQRLGHGPFLSNRQFDDAWKTPIDQETIQQHNPSVLLVACSDPDAMKQALSRMPALRQTTALQNGNLFFVDEATQDSVSQYLALAYYDLCQALVSSGDSPL